VAYERAGARFGLIPDVCTREEVFRRLKHVRARLARIEPAFATAMRSGSVAPNGHAIIA